MELFQDVNTINSRNELNTIWNYWLAKKNLLKTQTLTRGTKKQIDQIKSYLCVLHHHDNKLISQIRQNNSNHLNKK